MTIYISELKFENSDEFVEIVASENEDLSGYSIAVYNSSGSFQSSHSLAGEYETTIVGKDVYLVDRADGLPKMGQNWAVALIDDSGDVVQFIGGEGSTVTANDGPIAGETSSAGPVTTGGQSAETDTEGSTYYAQESPNPGTIPCFALGTRILTPSGYVPVEDLEVGDLVVTQDHSYQPIRYLAKSEMCGSPIPEHRLPVLIPSGILGSGLPIRDLVVSCQHRMLLDWREVRETYGDAEVLAPAKGLVRLPGVRVKRGVRQVQYIHLLFHSHEVIFAEGAPTESFYPGPTILRDMKRTDREALFREAPELENGVRAALGPPARKLLRVQETKKLAKRYKKRMKDEVAKWDVDLAMEQYERELLATDRGTQLRVASRVA